MTPNTIAREFVRLRDLQHCAQFWDIGISQGELREQWTKLLQTIQAYDGHSRKPTWMRHLLDALKYYQGDYSSVATRPDALREWHLACQEVDAYWSSYEQGVQARQLGIPRDAGIHSLLDDGTDTLTPWLAGWDEANARNPTVKLLPRLED